MGKKKTTTKNEPWSEAQPYILQGMQQTQRVFDQQQPQLDKYSGMAFDTYGKLNPGAVAGISGAQGLVNDTIGGKFLGGNPYLDRIIGQQTRDIQDGVNSQFTMAGRFGSGRHAGVLAREIGDASDRLRFQNYGMERQNQINAVGQAQDLMRGNAATLDQAATLPWTGVGAQVGNIRQASSGYGTTTTTTRDPWGTVMGLAGAGATAYASDPRIKKNVEPVGQGPGGLGVYEYDNTLTGQREQGVMADEVAAKAPGALGPNVGGVQTVNYGALGMDGPMRVGPSFSESAPTGQAIPDAAVKKGKVERWLDSVVSPDPNTTRGKIGILGQALMAGSGSAFAPLGQSLMAVRREQDAREEQQHDRAIEERRVGVLEDRAALGGAARIVQRRDGSVIAIDPVTLEETVISGPIAQPQPLVRVYDPKSPTGERYAPRDEAAGAPAGEPPKPAAASTAAPRARFQTFRVGQAVGGYTYVGGDPNDPNSWRR